MSTLIVPQLEREIQNDIVLTQPVFPDQAEQAGVVQPGGRVGDWGNPLVLTQAKGDATKHDASAVADALPASGDDGFEILRRMDLATRPVTGVLATETRRLVLRDYLAAAAFRLQDRLGENNMIGQWSGTPLSPFLTRIEVDTTARNVGFECADGDDGAIDMPTALHPKTLMACRLPGNLLPTRYGDPSKIHTPTKLKSKNPNLLQHFTSSTSHRMASGRIVATTGSAGSD